MMLLDADFFTTLLNRGKVLEFVLPGSNYSREIIPKDKIISAQINLEGILPEGCGFSSGVECEEDGLFEISITLIGGERIHHKHIILPTNGMGKIDIKDFSEWFVL